MTSAGLVNGKPVYRLPGLLGAYFLGNQSF